MFIPGPRRQSILLSFISIPVKVKSSVISSGLNVQAIKVPFGILNAFTPLSRRKPEGPSSQQPQGIPNSARCLFTPPNAAAVPSVTFKLPIPSPRTIQHKSSSVS